jgi:hypothetical protein
MSGIALTYGVRTCSSVGYGAKADARAEGGQEHECDADDDADVQQGEGSLLQRKCERPLHNK